MEIDHDLATLLGRILTLDPSIAPEARMNIENELRAKHIPFSVSQHYHHSNHSPMTHTQTQQHETPQFISEPPRLSCEMLLRQNSIDPTALLPPQLRLFRIADTAQQQRLIELWRICPPTKNVEDPSLAWTDTTVEQEESRTRQRLLQEHCKQVVHGLEHNNNNIAMSLDGTQIQSADGCWDPEPYMADGYMDMMQQYGYDPHAHAATYSPATDPVYRAIGCQLQSASAGVHMDRMDVVM